jgi:hypothetical protein
MRESFAREKQAKKSLLWEQAKSNSLGDWRRQKQL